MQLLKLALQAWLTGAPFAREHSKSRTETLRLL
jgi:hypothetical protein